ncbi:ribonuclease P 40kDa subunit-domain-containing protein [Boeremia exigua]|uniref:ribonuclease P 40kDa subunit-domain-containing protein n=1 Tax=Boeremia exigua TaxID=749465 RepID=UPI001E8D4F8E|nr:ribonuclease P 40kDa subunit-domain-containing protein [Boeremia exigua]KAH6614833.1 ribonuclease P 40kDa subunit-domain-containing protein [Boeremia exigua]
MLDVHNPPPSTDTKTRTTHARLPPFIDPHAPPRRKYPFAAFAATPSLHTLDLILPAPTWRLVRPALESHARVYARATLSLSDILDPAFLDAYIRPAHTTLLSTSRAGDTVFAVAAGQLRLELPAALYERAGLQGAPVADGGAKHARARWEVRCDLTAASMRAGKKGFERLRWAAREVLGERRVWLFSHADRGWGERMTEGGEVLGVHAPAVVALAPRVEALDGVEGPVLRGVEAWGREEKLELLEWLDMLSLGSARVRGGGAVDSHLCRYEVPDFGHGVETSELVRVRWSGFITPVVVEEVFLEVWKAGFVSKGGKGGADADADVTMESTQDSAGAGPWFAMSAQAFGETKAWSLMQFANRETLVWEVER